MDRVKTNQSRVLNCILKNREIAKNNIAKELNLSIPTVLHIVKRLLDEGIICESGTSESLIGRKAKLISLTPDWYYAIGVDITQNHVSIVLLNMRREVVKAVRIKKRFQTTEAYNREIHEEIDKLLKEEGVPENKILGIGFSLPGIVDRENGRLIKSHILGVENMRLSDLFPNCPYPVYVENDANAALLAEAGDGHAKAYVSLSNSVGGAFSIDGELFEGKGRAGEIGHMILHSGGKTCYCGNKGCVDAYCSARVLRTADNEKLESFFTSLAEREPEHVRIWEEYLDNLEQLLYNIHIILDSDIIIGGYVGYYIQPYMAEIRKRVSRRSLFEEKADYIYPSIRLQEVSAVGTASYFIKKYIDEFGMD